LRGGGGFVGFEDDSVLVFRFFLCELGWGGQLSIVPPLYLENRENSEDSWVFWGVPLCWAGKKFSGTGSHLSHSSNFVLLWHWDGLEEVRGLGRKSWVCFGAVYSYHLRLHLFFVLGQGFVRVSL